MKILHIIDTLSMGGAENVLIGLSRGQSKYGHNVTIMPLVCPNHTVVRSKIEKNGIIVLPLASKGTVYNPIFIFKLAKVLKHYDVVHVHLFPALYWAAIAKFLVFSKVPLVYTEHSTNNRRRKNALMRFIDYFIYENGYDMIVACAKKVQEEFKKSFPRIKHTCYVNNGIDLILYNDAKPYSKQELLNIPDNSFVLTMVSRFMHMKRQDTIIETLNRLQNNVHVVFVGGKHNDPGLIRVRNIAQMKNVSDRVHFLYIRNDVPKILKTSDVIILASDYEGLSLSCIEGMAAGKPFIATDVNGLREIVGGAGLLFKNRDSVELAEYIERLIEDKDFYNEIAMNCLKRSNEYGINQMVESYINIYNEVITN